VLLVHSWSGGQGRWVYWFVEALVHVLVATALVMRVPAVQRFERRRPFALPALLLVPTLAVRFDLVDLGPSHHVAFRSHEVAWLFVLGWLAASAATTRQRLLASAAVLAVVPGAFHEPTRDLIVLAGLLLLLWVPSIPVPRRVPPALAALAGASLYTYLSHVQVHPLVSDRSPVLGVALSLVVGWALWRVADPVVRRLVPSRTERTPIRMPTW
jgi:hypothetical protein